MQQLGVEIQETVATRLTCWTPQGPLIVDACRPHLEVVCEGHGVHAPGHYLQHLQQRSRVGGLWCACLPSPLTALAAAQPHWCRLPETDRWVDSGKGSPLVINATRQPAASM